MNYLIIFRISEDRFCELPYVNGELHQEGKTFTVHADDSYNLMRYDHIVIAEQIEGGSRDIMRFSIGNEDGTDLAVVHEIQFEEFQKIAQTLVTQIAH